MRREDRGEGEATAERVRDSIIMIVARREMPSERRVRARPTLAKRLGARGGLAVKRWWRARSLVLPAKRMFSMLK